MNVSIVSGVCILPDAISYSVVRKLDVLRQHFGMPHQVEYRVFVFGSNLADPRVKIYTDAGHLVMDPFFAASDVVVFEFGIYYSLFNSIFVLPPRTKKLVVYHNITPEHLVFREYQKEAVRLGMAQKVNLKYADHIAAVSDFNRLDLIRYGIPPEKISTLNLPLGEGFSPEGACLKSPRKTAELLYVGRFVASKGVLDLVQAVIATVQRRCTSVRLTLVGDTEFSDSAYIQLVRDKIGESGLQQHFRFVGAVTQEQLIGHYREADIFVIPSYHEGYCLPVIEALSSGCLVISYDAGNLPSITGGLGRLVPTGDIQALSGAILDLVHCVLSRPGSPHRLFCVDCGVLAASEYVERCKRYTSRFTFANFANQFSNVLRDLTA
jgi:glycosyltransferase involved in cell wall biosynthesis